MEQLSGTIIKGYELQDRIGAGGFGAVYRAHQSTVGREVAVKIILPGFANRPEFVRRFEAEAQTVARLEHMNITPLYDFWRDPEGAYLVMRYLRGGNLQTALRDDPYDLESAARLLDQVASALAVAHRNQVIHRDIKPANILLDEDGNGYVADFGLAKDLDNSVAAYTQDGDVLGTPDYLSPEQVRSEPVTPRSDIYSLGLVLYEMLTASHPFPDATPVERMFKQLNEPVPKITSLDQNTAEAINAVIQKATAKNPNQRYKDVLAMATAFREAAGLSVSQAVDKLVELLTPREQEVLKLIIEGKSNREISDALTIELTTVKWYVTQIYRKLNVRSRVQAIVRARELDLIVDGRSADALTASRISTLPEPENPYKGLQAFQIADEQDFFGREKLTQKLLARLGQAGDYSRFLAVVGPSGSGKSSLVRAGLIPALWRGDLPGSKRWYITDFIPGAHPLDELEVALIQVAANRPDNLREQLARDERGLMRAAQIILPDDDSELLIVIDQFEEIFTLVENETDRTHFLNLLHQAVTASRSRVRLVITLRADFYDRPLQYSDFGELVRSRMETVLPLSAAELDQAIVGPAQRVGIRFEDGLVAAIVSDINYQPGALPLLQFALTELFEARENRILTHQGYEQIGRAAGALAKRAEQLFLELSDEGREAVHQMFLRLVTLGEGSDDTRRRVARSELLAVAQDADLMDEVIDTYAIYRLLALDNDPATRGPTIEVAHEALIYAWGRLQQWLNESRADIRLQRLLAVAADEWLQADRNPGYLLRDSRLDQFEGWAATTNLALTEKERLYIDASLRARQKRETDEAARLQRELETANKLAETEKRRAEEQTQAANKLQKRAVFLGVALLIAAILAVAAVIFGQQASQNEQKAIAEANNRATAEANAEAQRAEAEHQAQIALSRELAASALNNLESDPERSILLAIEGLSAAHTLEAETALHTVLPASRIEYALSGHSAEVFELVYHPDGTQFATGSWDGTIKLWDSASGQEFRTLSGNGGPVFGVDYSPDGLRLAAANADGTATVWDVQSGQTLLTLSGHADLLFNVAYSPKGKYLATASVDQTVKVWNAETGEALLTLSGYEGFVNYVTFSPDGNLLAAGGAGGAVKIWDVIALLGENLDALTDTSSRELVSLASGGGAHNGPAFSPDGKLLATGTESGLVKIWDVEASIATASGQELLTVAGHTAPVSPLAFSPDGTRLASGSFDSTAKVWDVETGQELFTLAGHTGPITGIAFSPDGTRLATPSWDGTVRVWSLSSERELLTLNAHSSGVDGATAIAFNSGGTQLATAGDDGTVKIWSLDMSTTGASGILLSTVIKHSAEVWDVAFSLDGTRLAAAMADGTVKVWDTSSNRELFTLTSHTPSQFEAVFDGVTSVDFSPDSKILATSGDDGAIRLWDLATGQAGFVLQAFSADYSAASPVLGASEVAFSPDGAKLAATGAGGQVFVWDAISGKMLLTLTGHQEDTSDLAFSQDGTRVATASIDTTAKVWDVESGDLLLTLSGHNGPLFAVAFSPDGTRLATGSSDGRAKVWDAKTGEALLAFSGHNGIVEAVSFNPDGTRLLTSGQDGTVRAYVLSAEDLTTLARSRLTRSLTEAECQQYLHVEACPGE